MSLLYYVVHKGTRSTKVIHFDAVTDDLQRKDLGGKCPIFKRNLHGTKCKKEMESTRIFVDISNVEFITVNLSQDEEFISYYWR
jgi:hypothetical protein